MLAVVGVLYIEHALSYLSTRSLAASEAATVRRLTKDNAQLLQQQRSLQDPATIARNARALGMIQAGERPYVLTAPPGQQ